MGTKGRSGSNNESELALFLDMLMAERGAAAETIDNLKDFVFKGPFRDQGMPDFTGKLTEADVVKVQAFIQGTADAIRPK